MRLGQGFNSYTQQICVDDAVLIDPLRAENVVSNDGTTMRIMAQKEAKPSAWTRQREIITDEKATDDIKQKEDISTDEQSALDKVKDQRPAIGTNLRVTAPAGSLKSGTSFNNLDFLQPDWNLTKVRIQIEGGAVQAFWLHYDNGLIISRGQTRNGKMVEMSEFAMGERIIAATVHTGIKDFGIEEARVISLNLYTNRGRSLIGQASTCIYQGREKKHLRDDIVYRDVSIKSFDSPLKDGNLKGLWGRSDDTAIWRLGLIWGDINKDAANATENVDVSADPITAAKAETATLRSQTESAKEECLRSERASLWGNRSSSWRNDQVQIFHILYNGQTITNDTVAKRLLDKARYQESFQWTLPLFELDHDPAYGVVKAAFVFYRYNDTGPLRVLSGYDMQTAKFDPLPS